MNTDDSCPLLNKAAAQEFMLNAGIVDEFSDLDERCPLVGGLGKKKYRGGVQKAIIKKVIYVIITVLVAMNVSANAGLIYDGLSQLAAGSCNPSIWNLFGYGFMNPVCSSWNRILRDCAGAILLKPDCIAEISAIIGSPILLANRIDWLATTLGDKDDGAKIPIVTGRNIDDIPIGVRMKYGGRRRKTRAQKTRARKTRAKKTRAKKTRARKTRGKRTHRSKKN